MIDDERLGLFLDSFRLRFPNKEAALEQICVWLEEAGNTVCQNCGSNHTRRDYGTRSRKCLDCRKQRSVTAATYFHNIRKPLEWLCAMELLDQGIVSNKTDLNKVIGLAPAAASTLFDKIMKTLGDTFFDGGFVWVESSSFLSIIGKRSIETPANASPREEQTEAEKKANKLTRTSNQPDPAGQGQQKQITPTIEEFEFMPEAQHVYALLSAGDYSSEELSQASALDTGATLSGLTLLEIYGVVRKDQYGRYSLSSPHTSGGHMANDSALEIARDEAVGFIRSRFRSISRKYLQLYLVAHWWHKQKERWKQSLIRNMCVTAEYLRGKDLRHYVSALEVKVAAL